MQSRRYDNNIIHVIDASGSTDRLNMMQVVAGTTVCALSVRDKRCHSLPHSINTSLSELRSQFGVPCDLAPECSSECVPVIELPPLQLGGDLTRGSKALNRWEHRRRTAWLRASKRRSLPPAPAQPAASHREAAPPVTFRVPLPVPICNQANCCHGQHLQRRRGGVGAINMFALCSHF